MLIGPAYTRHMYPVLIIGAGPVGLALAGDLAWRGVHALLIERSDGVIEQPRMDMVGIRTMEFARRWGIVRDVETSPYPRDYPQDNIYVTSMTGWELGREHMPSMGEDKPPVQSPQKRERCPQDMFDPILRRWVERQGKTELRYRTELLGFEQHADHITARIRDVTTGREETIASEYIVGCDGASSRVRELLGIPMNGTPVLTNTTNVIFRDPDFDKRHDKAPGYRQIFIGPEGMWATIVAIDGAERRRMSITRAPREGLTHEQIAALIRRAIGRDDVPIEILSVTNWTRRELVAEHYGGGRAFIAGDAAHVMSPTGGFGMNTGIADAVDLSWKLDAMLQGWGGPELARSYTIERKPVAERNVRESSKNLKHMLSPGVNPTLCDDSREGEMTRARVGAAFKEAMRNEWFTLGIHLGYRMDDSPIIAEDGTPRPPLETARYVQTARPGGRAPHVYLRDGRSTLDLFGRGFVLLVLGGGDPNADEIVDEFRSAAAASGMPLTVVGLDEDAVTEAYGARYVLVRPDGNVAWRGHDVRKASAIVDRVRGAATARVG